MCGSISSNGPAAVTGATGPFSIGYHGDLDNPQIPIAEMTDGQRTTLVTETVPSHGRVSARGWPGRFSDAAWADDTMGTGDSDSSLRRPSASASDSQSAICPVIPGCGCIYECIDSPKCRHDHRLKEHPRWHVDQLSDGTFRWSTPSGRQYTTEPTRYPI